MQSVYASKRNGCCVEQRQLRWNTVANRYDPDSVETHINELYPDEDDLALLRHVMLEEDRPQGLHQGGWITCTRHRDEQHRRNQKCWLCEREIEDQNASDYLYPETYDWDDLGA
jgi:hypothetical protein